MKKRKMKLWFFRARYIFRKARKLRRIEKAVGIRLRQDQRAVVMSDNYPDFYGWERGSGKTVAACMWTLLNRPYEVVIEKELSKLDPGRTYSMTYYNRLKAVPDPDADTVKRYMNTLNVLRAMKKQCVDHNVHVCDIRVMHASRHGGGRNGK